MDGLAPLDENNPENNIKSFGQFIPLVLLALIPLAIIEDTFANISSEEHYKETHMGHHKAGFWRWWLGPDKADGRDDRDKLHMAVFG
ncbi:hypothetical protein LTR17_008526 [Elasticomyces elasticus]|nr:hypothetical protein LTR17_008526 [Elasticomyces elasticus]